MMASLLPVTLSALKYISILLGGAFGILAFLVDYKDASGKLTRWGRIAIIGVIVSAGTSVGTQALESFLSEIKARASAQAAAENLRRSELALIQMERLLQPLDTPRVTVVWAFPSKIPGADDYVARVSAFGHRLQEDPTLASDPANGISVSSYKKGNIPSDFSIKPSSPLYPDRRSEPELQTLLLGTGALVSIFATNEAAVSARKVIEATDGRSRLSLGYFGSLGDLGFDIETENARLEYSIESNRFSVWLEDPVDSSYVRKTGDVVSIPDLERGTLMLSTNNATVPSFGGSFPALDSGRKLIRPEIIFFRVSGHEYIFGKDTFVTTIAKSGEMAFAVGPITKGKSK